MSFGIESLIYLAASNACPSSRIYLVGALYFFLVLTKSFRSYQGATNVRETELQPPKGGDDVALKRLRCDPQPHCRYLELNEAEKVITFAFGTSSEARYLIIGSD